MVKSQPPIYPMTTAPVTFEWDGEAMVPASAFLARLAGRQYVVGQRYTMVEERQRSNATHNHEFAVLSDAWSSLPERFADEAWAQSPEHLRKYALIKTRYSDSQTFACGSRAEAERWAANLRPLDEFSIVVVRGSTVVRFTAKSQSRKAMGAKDFQASKQAILEFVSDLIGVTPQTLEREAGKAA